MPSWNDDGKVETYVIIRGRSSCRIVKRCRYWKVFGMLRKMDLKRSKVAAGVVVNTPRKRKGEKC